MSNGSHDNGHGRVALADCRDYSAANVMKAVRNCFDLLGESSRILKAGSRVLLKPNLLSCRHGGEYPINTHPEVISSVAQVLSGDFKCKLWIGDSCGSFTKGSTSRAIAVMGIDKTAARVGAQVFNVDRERRRVHESPDAAILRTVELPEALDGFDVVLSLAKLKTHGLTRYTGAIKNLFGLIPGKGKKRAHVIAPAPDMFAQMLTDLASIVRPGFAMIDAVVGMEGNGPNEGDARHLGFIGASADPVALDAVCSDIIGYKRGRVPTLVHSAARGLGVDDPGRIDVLGRPKEDFSTPNFKKPPSDRFLSMAGMVPTVLFGRLMDEFSACYSSVREDRCRLCGECVRNCPAGAMTMTDSCVVVSRDKCIACYCCSEVCPYKAIVMRRTHAAQLVASCTTFFTGRRD